MDSKNCTEEGVSELHLFENCVDGSEKERIGPRSWLSTNAILRLAVAGEEPGGYVSKRMREDLVE